MSAEKPSADKPEGNGQADPGLPPVEPPSGRFMAQLFLIPLLIVSVVVLLVLGSHYLVSERRTPAHYLRELDNPNLDIRWRGAHELAQVLKRPESLALASDVKFALDLAERVSQETAELEKAVQATAAQIAQLPQEEKDAAWRKLGDRRNYALYLIATLGDFTVPVGAPLLMDIGMQPNGPDLKGSTLLRRRAVWALANLGENVKRYRTLSADKKEAVVATLVKESKGSTPRAAWARTAHDFVTRGKPLGVDAALEKIAGCDDPYTRALVAHAFNFWDGPRAEPTLLKLARDDGWGVRVEITEND